MVGIKDITDSLDEQNNASQSAANQAAELDVVKQSGDKVAQAVDKGSQDTVKALGDVKGEVKVINPDLAKSQDVTQAVEAINKLNLTTFMQNDGLPKLAQNLSDLSDKTEALQEKMENEGLKKMSDQLSTVVQKLDVVSKALSNSQVKVDTKLQKTIDSLSREISMIDFNPTVNVTAPEPKVIAAPIDLKPVIAALSKIEKAVNVEAPETEVDLSPVVMGLNKVVETISSITFPSPNYVLPFKDQDGKAVQVKLNSDGSLPITSGGGGGGAVTVADGADVTLGAKADAKSTATDTTAVSVMSVLKQISASAQAPPSQAVTNTGTFAVQAALGAETTKVIGTVRTSDGAGNLYTSNSTTYTAKFAQDGNLLGTLGTAFSTAGKVDVKAADGDVFVRSNAASTFPTQATLQTQTDTVMIGGVNVKEINAVTPLMGNGTTGTGSQRVTIASDNTVLPGVGAGATAASVPANASYGGLRGTTALPAAVTDGQTVGAMGDKYGRQIAVPFAPRDLVLPMTQLTLTATTVETTLISAVASTFLDLASLVVINTSGTATQVDFRDDTAGTIRLSLYVPAGDTRGATFTTPLPQAVVNKPWTAKCGTSVSSVIITGTYITNK